MTSSNTSKAMATDHQVLDTTYFGTEDALLNGAY